MGQGVQSCFGTGLFFRWMYTEPYFPQYHRNKQGTFRHSERQACLAASLSVPQLSLMDSCHKHLRV